MPDEHHCYRPTLDPIQGSINIESSDSFEGEFRRVGSILAEVDEFGELVDEGDEWNITVRLTDQQVVFPGPKRLKWGPAIKRISFVGRYRNGDIERKVSVVRKVNGFFTMTGELDGRWFTWGF